MDNIKSYYTSRSLISSLKDSPSVKNTPNKYQKGNHSLQSQLEEKKLKEKTTYSSRNL